MNQEQAFKLVFTVAAIVFCLTVIGFFLLALKIILLFTPEIHFMGFTIKNTITMIQSTTNY